VRGLLGIFKRSKKKARAPEEPFRESELFKEQYRCFQTLLSENNSVLGVMADMEEKLSGGHIFDMSYVRSTCKIMAEKVQNIIENLNKLSGRRYLGLYDAFEKINSGIEETLIKEADIPAEVLKSIVPLNLICPEDKRFRPEYCETFHDITQFAHETAMIEMFKISDSPNIRKRKAAKLEVALPLEIYVLDLDGGVENGSKKKITPDNIRSIPMNAFLKGMMAMEWPGPKPLNVKGFLTVVAHTSMDPQTQESLMEPSFAVISKEYMNFSIRMGYHIQTIEAYAGDNINDNYIRFFIKGGGASSDRRARRTRLIKEILEKIDFSVDRIGDVLDARITKYDKGTIQEKLGTLARLTAYTKQLDMTLFNEAIVDWYVQEFIKKHCAVERKPDRT
jgi:pyruvate,water dikinase